MRRRSSIRRCRPGYVKSKKTGNCVYATGRKGRSLSKKRASKKRSHKREGRPSPNVSANSYPAGYRMKGHDGGMWKISVSSNGSHRWIRA